MARCRQAFRMDDPHSAPKHGIWALVGISPVKLHSSGRHIMPCQQASVPFRRLCCPSGTPSRVPAARELLKVFIRVDSGISQRGTTAW